jgi:hypothetical protein
MTTFDIATTTGSACGVLMVFGSMFLLAKGVISLNETRKSGATTLEVKKLFRLSSDNPALGLFVVGLAFILTSAALAKPADSRITVIGFLKDADIEDPDQIRISMRSSMQDVVNTSNQQIEATADANGPRQVTITYPGYRTVELPLHGSSGKLNLGEIHLVKVAEKPEVNSKNIVPLPDGFNERKGGY